MSYLRSTLAEDETVEHEAKFHWTYTLFAWLFLIVGALFSLIVWAGISSSAHPEYAWFAYVLAGLFVFHFLRLMVAKWSTEIAVTNKRFLVKKGWIRRNSEELPMKRVEELGIRQGILGRIFGFGKVSVSGTGGDEPIVTPNIDDPLTLRKAIGRQS